jgi:hypothetical protein
MTRQIILGMGAGQCGLPLLAQILSHQPDSLVTHEQLPWLPWEVRPNGPGIRERLTRIAATATTRRAGDVAAFYLPYISEAVDFQPSIRIVCLQRPREEIIVEFSRSLDQSMRLPTDHWAREPAPGWHHDPFATPTFPQYDTTERTAGIGRYWDDYYTAAERLARRFPDNVRVWDTSVLTDESGVREVLSWAGIPAAEQVVLTGKQVSPANGTAVPHQQATESVGRLDRSRCVVLVPYLGSIHRECDDALQELERRGYEVRRVGGYAAIDQGRSQMVTDALRDGFEETLWIDADIGFDPDAVERLRSHSLPIVCGIYPQKGKRELACHVLPGTVSVTFGQQGGLVELLYAGTGFLLVRREVYLKVQQLLKLPICNERFGQRLIPLFLPLLHPVDDGYWYLAEDFAFCQRAREAGFRIFADTSIRLWHIGTYRYGWEEAGSEPKRFGTFTLHLEQQAAVPGLVSSVPSRTER